MEAGSRDPFLGMVLQGQTIEMLVGRGALTTVYRTRATAAGFSLLVTFLVLPEMLSPQIQWQFRERFWHLVEQIASLRHPNLLPLYGYGERNGQCYLLTPDLPGRALLASQHAGWSPQEVLQVLLPLASAFACLHQQGLSAQFFHPSMLQVLEGSPDLASGLHLTGGGLMSLVRHLDEQRDGEPDVAYRHLQSVAGHYLGAPDYLAPEVVQGWPADARSDVYTLGVLLFALLSGRTPFLGQHYLQIAQQHVTAPLPALHSLTPSVPIVLEGVIHQALSRDPALRFPHPQALVDAYTSAVQEPLQRPTRYSSLPGLLHLPSRTRHRSAGVISYDSFPEPTSEPLPAISIPWEQIHTAPLCAISPITAPHSAVTSPLQLQATPANAAQQEAPSNMIRQMARDLHQQRERLQQLARSLEPTTSTSSQEPPTQERFPGWLT
jgi:serine/threonine protein kinase